MVAVGFCVGTDVYDGRYDEVMCIFRYISPQYFTSSKLLYAKFPLLSKQVLCYIIWESRMFTQFCFYGGKMAFIIGSQKYKLSPALFSKITFPRNFLKSVHCFGQSSEFRVCDFQWELNSRPHAVVQRVNRFGYITTWLIL